MSHTTKIKDSAIKDVRAIKTAARRLRDKGVNCELIENASPRMYYHRQQEQCEYVLRLNDSLYDVGFQLQDDGSYAAVFDEWDNQVMDQIGGDWTPLPTQESRRRKHIGKFYEEYALAEVQNACMADGELNYEGFEQDDDGLLHMSTIHVGS